MADNTSAATATLNGKPCTCATIHLPRWGISHADVDVADEELLTGKVELVIGDLKFIGTVVHNRSGVYAGKASYYIVAGANGWGKKVRDQGYRNDAGVKVSTLLKDVEEACGETMAAYPEGTVGTSYDRVSGPASAVPQYIAQHGWYVDEAGKTHIGLRPETPISGDWAVTNYEPQHDRFELAADSIAEILPGVVITDKTFGADADGKPVSKVAGDVVHHVDSTGLRTTISAVKAAE